MQSMLGTGCHSEWLPTARCVHVHSLQCVCFHYSLLLMCMDGLRGLILSMGSHSWLLHHFASLHFTLLEQIPGPVCYVKKTD